MPNEREEGIAEVEESLPIVMIDGNWVVQCSAEEIYDYIISREKSLAKEIVKPLENIKKISSKPYYFSGKTDMWKVAQGLCDDRKSSEESLLSTIDKMMSEHEALLDL